MGWLGWSYETTLDTPMDMITLAHDGLVDKLQAIHGGGDAPDQPPAQAPPKKMPALNAQLFDAIYG